MVFTLQPISSNTPGPSQGTTAAEMAAVLFALDRSSWQSHLHVKSSVCDIDQHVVEHICHLKRWKCISRRLKLQVVRAELELRRMHACSLQELNVSCRRLVVRGDQFMSMHVFFLDGPAKYNVAATSCIQTAAWHTQQAFLF
jgi:hypothetical protein